MRERIVICASGDGSNFQALVEASRKGLLEANVVGLITNKKKIGAIGRARSLDIPFRVLQVEEFPNRIAWDQAMLKQLQDWQADWVVLAGFLTLIGPKVLEAFPQRIVNSHPALLPKYGGKGMYGTRVHRKVLKSGDKETGITFHWVDGKYDEGGVIEQHRIPIKAGESEFDLEERVKREENRLFPLVLAKLMRVTH
jgi:phosphoribosylglycinamide formyltransferase-1